MLDALYLVLLSGFGVLSLAFIALCELLRGGGK
jgi:hypothetical protein